MKKKVFVGTQFKIGEVVYYKEVKQLKIGEKVPPKKLKRLMIITWKKNYEYEGIMEGIRKPTRKIHAFGIHLRTANQNTKRAQRLRDCVLIEAL